jgi:hypothetical protein
MKFTEHQRTEKRRVVGLPPISHLGKSAPLAASYYETDPPSNIRSFGLSLVLNSVCKYRLYLFYRFLAITFNIYPHDAESCVSQDVSPKSNRNHYYSHRNTRPWSLLSL